MSTLFSFFTRVAPAAFVFGLATSQAVPAQSTATIVVNGRQVQFDQPPVEQAGRLFVPLRGVFERLGASVVYDDGRINATSGTTTIQLQIGSTQALVSGHATTLDAPPFLIGGRALVPLRFISQALGASVNYVASSQTVYVDKHGVGPRPPAPPPAVSVGLIHVQPAPGWLIAARRPEISATFAQRVDPGSVRIALDGRDITSEAYVSGRSFVFSPPYDVPPGSHDVSVGGRIAGGPPFADNWQFNTRPAQRINFISELAPPNGAHTGFRFTVSGRTLPGARVRIVATSDVSVAQFVDVQGRGTAQTVGAGPDGRFYANVGVPDLGSGVIDVRVVSTAPDGGEAVRTLRLRP